MHPNYSPSADTHSSLSPKSPPLPPTSTETTNDGNPKDETDSGFTLMHPAFQRQTPKRSHETPNPSMYGQPNTSGDQHQTHSAQDLTTSVHCSGSFVGHPLTGMAQGGRSTSSTPDDTRELDLTAYRAKKNDENTTNNNTC